MSIHTTTIEPDLRITPGPVLVALGLTGMVFIAVRDLQPSGELRDAALRFTLSVYALTAGAWLLLLTRPALGRWITIAAVAAAILLAQAWFAAPGTLLLLAAPVILTAALIRVSAALVTATALSVLLLLGAWLKLPGILMPGSLLTLACLWGAVALMAGVYRRVNEVAQWSQQHYEQAQALLDEARDRQVELRQALDDLAQANRQLTRLNALAQGLRQMAEDARTAKAQFVANVSHELRTPLNMITGFSEMILQHPEVYGGPIPVALLTDLSVIQRNAQHLGELINDVLDLSQVEADQMALTKEQTALVDVLYEATDAVRPLYESKALDLDVEVEPHLPPLYCDRTRIHEVLLNLLSNAGRFTERGGVRLSAQR